MEQPESRETGVRRRGPLTWLVAAAAVAVIVVAVVFVLDQRREEPVADPAAPDASASEVTLLSAPAEEQGRCRPPAVDLLQTKPVAFEGTVEAVEDDAVTLRVERWYAGGATDLVEIEAPDERLGALLTSVRFEEDGRYLVAADEDGRVMLCGFSAAWSPGLERLYAEAFAA